MSNRLVNLVFRGGAIGLALYSSLGANLAYAAVVSAPAPLVGVVGGPVVFSLQAQCLEAIWLLSIFAIVASPSYSPSGLI